MDLISVIIPIYKVEPYLKRCIDSVINQTYGNLEIILVDDGSPDRCGDICDDYALTDSRVRVIHQENAGISAARNAGIDVASGACLAFIDSDDWIHEDYITILYGLLCKTNADIAVCSLVKVYTEQIQLDTSSEEVFEFTGGQEIQNLSMDKLHLIMVLPSVKIYRKHLFDDIRYPVGKFHEDEFVVHRLLHAAEKVVYTPKQLMYYQQRPDSFMGVGFKLKHKKFALEALADRAAFLKEIGMDNLSDSTYKKLFGMYLSTKRKISDADDSADCLFFDESFRELRTFLRRGRHPLKFKVFYELYFMLPGTMDLVQRIHEKKIYI